MVAVGAAHALNVLHDQSWIAVGRERFNRIRHPMIKLAMGGALADAGCYDGWPLVRDTLRTKDADQALSELPSFVGMKGPGNAEVDLAALVRKAMPSMNKQVQVEAEFIIERINAKKSQKQE